MPMHKSRYFLKKTKKNSSITQWSISWFGCPALSLTCSDTAWANVLIICSQYRPVGLTLCLQPLNKRHLSNIYPTHNLQSGSASTEWQACLQPRIPHITAVLDGNTFLHTVVGVDGTNSLHTKIETGMKHCDSRQQNCIGGNETWGSVGCAPQGACAICLLRGLNQLGCHTRLFI